MKNKFSESLNLSKCFMSVSVYVCVFVGYTLQHTQDLACEISITKTNVSRLDPAAVAHDTYIIITQYIHTHTYRHSFYEMQTYMASFICCTKTSTVNSQKVIRSRSFVFISYICIPVSAAMFVCALYSREWMTLQFVSTLMTSHSVLPVWAFGVLGYFLQFVLAQKPHRRARAGLEMDVL